MPEFVLSISDVKKSFADKLAVKGISADVVKGEIFGLLGPNGAGKTTTIRMLMGIIKPDSGTVRAFGNFFGEQAKPLVGYLPEERGLYEDLTVMENLSYLGALKGASKERVKADALKLLNEVGMQDAAHKKVKTLSKGMHQLVQLVAVLVHNPLLLILDEPFSGLDPINRELVKDIILKQKKMGKTIILSTHMMEEVEELCDRVLMINMGKRVLYGNLEEIRGRYAKHAVYIEFEGKLPKLDGVEKVEAKKNRAELHLRIDVTPKQILSQLVQSKVSIQKYEVCEMSLNRIFIALVEAEKKWEEA